MPNYCSNCLVVRPVNSDGQLELQRFVDRVGDGKNTLSKFNPLPGALQGLQTGSCMAEVTYPDGTVKNETSWIWKQVERDGETVNVGFTREQVSEMKRAYGAANWYDWCCTNWGTKWDCDFERVCYEDEVMFTFDSAWSPPEVWLDFVSKRFPNLSFELAFAEGGMAYWGVTYVENGEAWTHLNEGNFWRDTPEMEDEDYYDADGLDLVTDEVREHLTKYHLNTGG